MSSFLLNSSNPGFGKLLTSKQWSDVIFLVGPDKQKFEAHKLVLRGASEVFDDLFKNNSDQNTFEVPDLEPRAFDLMLTFLYTGKYENMETIEDGMAVLKAASHYGILELTAICNSADFELKITAGNVLQIYQEAVKYNHEVLIERALNTICSNGYKIIESADFLELKIEALVAILARDDLNVPSEADLYDAVVNWGRAECKRQELPETPKDLRSMLERVIPLIRFPVMDPKDFRIRVLPVTDSILLPEEIITVLVEFSVPEEERVLIPNGLFNCESRVEFEAVVDEDDRDTEVEDISESGSEIRRVVLSKIKPKSSTPHAFRIRRNSFKLMNDQSDTD